MDWQTSATLMIAGILVLMFIGTPVVIAFLATNILGSILFMGGIAGVDQLISNATTSITSFTLVPVPLFLLMGEILFHTGLANLVFSALDKCFGSVKGRLSYLTVAGGTIFATLSGSSMANTAMLGSTLMPDMLKRGYKPKVIIGPIVATGSIAMIIPPSSLAVLLGSLGRIDVGALLLAGVIPGLLLALMFLLIIFVQVRLDPDAAPSYQTQSVTIGDALWSVVRDVLPMGLVIFSVIGLIILGFATPTESAALGALSVLFLAAIYGRLSLDALRHALEGTLKVSVMMLVIIIASTTFSQLLAFSGASAGLISWVTGFDLGSTATLFMIIGVLIVLGMFMDQLSIMMLSLPIFMPLMAMHQFDPVLFGVIMLLALELSLVTPPFGLLLFVMVGVSPSSITIGDVAWASLPYVSCTLIVILLLIFFPQIALWLPQLK